VNTPTAKDDAKKLLEVIQEDTKEFHPWTDEIETVCQRLLELEERLAASQARRGKLEGALRIIAAKTPDLSKLNHYALSGIIENDTAIAREALAGEKVKCGCTKALLKEKP